MSDLPANWPQKRGTPAYVNHTTMDKAMCREYLAIRWKKTGGMVRKILLVVAAAAAAYAVWQLVQNGLPGLLQSFSLLVVGGVALFLGLAGYRLRLGTYVKSQQLAWGDKTLDKTVSFYEDEMVQTSRLGEKAFDYEDIRYLVIGKQTVVFMLQEGAMLVNKDGFENAGYEEVVAFLRKACGFLRVVGGPKELAQPFADAGEAGSAEDDEAEEEAGGIEAPAAPEGEAEQPAEGE